MDLSTQSAWRLPAGRLLRGCCRPQNGRLRSAPVSGDRRKEPYSYGLNRPRSDFFEGWLPPSVEPIWPPLMDPVSNRRHLPRLDLSSRFLMDLRWLASRSRLPALSLRHRSHRPPPTARRLEDRATQAPPLGGA